ncbi:MAG: DegV family EDD domain-containing protein [Tissierellia bacterium]|nr:DegV family EDD domain-containing protein [Tissierellia bacterium]
MEYIQCLNGENLYGSFISGAREVIKNKNALNDINVFPVADRDTGTNLASTMNYIIEESKIDKTAKSTMSSIADAALLGARGNSGIIMAQYINGMFMSLNEEEEITISGFAESIQNAFPHAYNSISDPVEGTMITVIREWAQAVYNKKDTSMDFYDLLGQPLEVAFKSLEETTSKLKVLQRSKVVDSGAKGFVHFIQGFTEFIKTGKVAEVSEIVEEIHSFHEMDHRDGNIEHRYCTEAMLTCENIDLNILKEKLKDQGDSLIVAGNNTKARIHVHTNTPEKIFQILRQEGNIIQQKVDDMKRQYQAAFDRKYNIALVTDSIADLPEEIMDKYQIHLLPLNLVMEGTSYLDKRTMTAEIFYDILDDLEEYPSSAQPSPKVIEHLYSSLLENYDEILVISVAKEQSGTNNLFQQAAKKMARSGKIIRVIDSKQNSGAEGLLVMKAAEMIHNGESLDNIIQEIEFLRDRTQILVSVNTLKYMVRSGRLSKAGGVLGKLINLKPVVSLDEKGAGSIADMAFSINSNTKKIMNRMKRYNENNKITRYAIVHANNPVRAEEYRRKCVEILNCEPEYIMNISTIVGISAGVGSVAVAYMSERGVNNG